MLECLCCFWLSWNHFQHGYIPACSTYRYVRRSHCIRNSHSTWHWHFLLQMLPYLTMHFPLTFSKIQPFVSHITFEIKYPLIDFLYQLYYISSALSFYFIYDFCLYSSMSPLVSYFIRYLPLFIVVITATVVLAIRYYTCTCVCSDSYWLSISWSTDSNPTGATLRNTLCHGMVYGG